MFSSKPAIDSFDDPMDPDEIESIVDDIADMVFLANGGHETDWNEYPIEIYRLFCEWRRAERSVDERRQKLINDVLKANYCK